MFAEHQPQLSALGRYDADGFERICTFVLLTIRRPLRIVCADYKLVRQGDHSPLFGSKHAGLAYIRQHKARLLDECECAYHYAETDIEAENDLLLILIQIPGIGPTKAGFVVQMLYGLSGCIDTHNLARFSLKEKTFYLDKTKPAAMRRRANLIRDYNQFCRKVGGTAALWDEWCAYLAERDPVNYPTAHRVSELHLAPLEC